MTRSNQQESGTSAQKPEKEILRDKRRADALRANLKRRKTQIKSRTAATDAADRPGYPIESP